MFSLDQQAIVLSVLSLICVYVLGVGVCRATVRNAGSAESLKLQSTFAGGIGEFGDSAVKLVGSSVKAGFGDTGSNRTFGDRRADDFRSIAVATVTDLFCEGLVPGACRGECSSCFIVDQLAIQMLVAAPNAQSRAGRISPDLLTHPVGPTPALLVNQFLFSHRTISL